jgi:hypothetical protein
VVGIYIFFLKEVYTSLSPCFERFIGVMVDLFFWIIR